MKTLIFSLPGSDELAQRISRCSGHAMGEVVYHTFPDGEIGMRIDSDVAGTTSVIVANLDRPNEKIVPLYFLSSALRSAGSMKVILVCPYLPYMRQDTVFHNGEALTSRQFSTLLSGMVDTLVTVDPHLHRYRSLDELYTIPTRVVHTAPLISQWIVANVKHPLIIGPDVESEQWVKSIAERIDAPYYILKKQRTTDHKVVVYLQDISQVNRHRTPVLVDDIISTANTMISAVRLLVAAGMESPVCMGIHAIFANDSFQQLANTDIGHIVTTNSITHATNAIDITDSVCTELMNLIETKR